MNEIKLPLEAVTHRAVSGIEHDPSRSLFHGCCALCANPWPCDAEKELQAARLAAIRGGAQQSEGSEPDEDWSIDVETEAWRKYPDGAVAAVERRLAFLSGAIFERNRTQQASGDMTRAAIQKIAMMLMDEPGPTTWEEAHDRAEHFANLLRIGAKRDAR